MGHRLPSTCLASASATGLASLAHLDPHGLAHLDYEARPESPIDRAFDALQTIAEVASGYQDMWKPQHGLILSAAAVSAAEDYFRSVLTETVALCVLCRARVADLETRMEYVSSGSLPEALRAHLDRTSFSKADTVKDTARSLTGVSIPSGSSLSFLLNEFEVVCHIRHCAVHSGGYVASHNASVLDVPPGSWISFKTAQPIYRIVRVVTACVRAFNQTLFEHVLGRWIDQRLLAGEWNADRDAFDPLWRTFRSALDTEGARKSGQEGFYSNSFHAHRSISRAVRLRLEGT